jgi:hypothetical protein
MAAGTPSSVVIRGDNVGAIQVGGDHNYQSVTQIASNDQSENGMRNNMRWLRAELIKGGIRQDDVDDLTRILRNSSEHERVATARTWRDNLVGRVADVAGQVIAGTTANMITSLLLKFFGISTL